MSNPNPVGTAWAAVNIDPTAGVTLAPRVRCCPRCGVVKGPWGKTRGGLCHDCVVVLPPADRAAWRTAA